MGHLALIGGSVDKSRLPSGYTKLAYIQSSGEQYIALNYKPKSTTRIIADFQVVEETSDYQAVFGSRGPGTAYANRFCFYLTGSKYFRSDYGTTNQNFSTDISTTERHTVDKNQNVTTIDGKYSVTNTEETFTGTENLFLFGNNTGGTASELGGVRSWGYLIYEDDVPMYELVPCVDADGNIGMYDLVSKAFHGNAGTGSFIGSEVA